MALTPSTMLPLGTPAPPFDLPEPVTGQTASLDDFKAAPALVVAFICNHCPYVKHIRQALRDFAETYQARGVAFVGISANDATAYPDDAPARMAEEKADAGYTFPYLYDESQEVARAYRAACTPDFYVFDADRALVYRGQFDDSRPGNDIPPTGRDLGAASTPSSPARPSRATRSPASAATSSGDPATSPTTSPIEVVPNRKTEHERGPRDATHHLLPTRGGAGDRPRDAGRHGGGRPAERRPDHGRRHGLLRRRLLRRRDRHAEHRPPGRRGPPVPPLLQQREVHDHPGLAADRPLPTPRRRPAARRHDHARRGDATGRLPDGAERQVAPRLAGPRPAGRPRLRRVVRPLGRLLQLLRPRPTRPRLQGRPGPLLRPQRGTHHRVPRGLLHHRRLLRPRRRHHPPVRRARATPPSSSTSATPPRTTRSRPRPRTSTATGAIT